ncbi:MAG: hypothetical protein EOQ70_13750 [Mesorhizobium sp.]|nr:hypothetical protein EOA34_23890 [Mesorhizobium sp. M4B.F.Ca.ET.013.02.1.1]RWG87108.1 MAG: hypothetical protein EOQ70_13750 [Mesorhizobium sp.]RWK18254.1 MAG: hypothetical protein EOR41_13985 [Mesorhizobium sp.]TGV22682.1 hypothetical protein EN786_28120 [Mesorhizobium sp. M4B.F.Ca.ET.143.01.1.1]
MADDGDSVDRGGSDRIGFKNGRQFVAWLGLVPKQRSSTNPRRQSAFTRRRLRCCGEGRACRLWLFAKGRKRFDRPID